jgi:hypothetical protein
MAVTPKTPRSTPRGKAASTTLSASEALKAAEAAIGVPPVKAPPVKAPPVVKPPRVKAGPSAEPAPALASPAAVAAATTAVDAAPEPMPVTEEAAQAEPMSPVTPIIESLSKAEAIATEPLPVTEGTTIMNEVIENGRKFAEDTKAKMETAYADFNEKTKAHVEKSTKAIEELSDIAKGNVEALVESGKIAAKAMETLGQEAVDYSRKSFEKATASFKSFSTVKTPTEFFQLQSQLLSSSFDEFTKEAAKNSEALLKIAGEVTQPLTARVTVVTDKVKSLAA